MANGCIFSSSLYLPSQAAPQGMPPWISAGTVAIQIGKRGRQLTHCAVMTIIHNLPANKFYLPTFSGLLSGEDCAWKYLVAVPEAETAMSAKRLAIRGRWLIRAFSKKCPHSTIPPRMAPVRYVPDCPIKDGRDRLIYDIRGLFLGIGATHSILAEKELYAWNSRLLLNMYGIGTGDGLLNIHRFPGSFPNYSRVPLILRRRNLVGKSA